MIGHGEGTELPCWLLEPIAASGGQECVRYVVDKAENVQRMCKTTSERRRISIAMWNRQRSLSSLRRENSWVLSKYGPRHCQERALTVPVINAHGSHIPCPLFKAPHLSTPTHPHPTMQFSRLLLALALACTAVAHPLVSRPPPVCDSISSFAAPRRRRPVDP